MPLIDSTLLLPLITGDTPAEAKRASELITSYSEGELTLPDYSLAELTFILEWNTHYQWSRPSICDALDDIVVVPQINTTRVAQRALDAYRQHPKLDYTDCLLQAQAAVDRTSIVKLK